MAVAERLQQKGVMEAPTGYQFTWVVDFPLLTVNIFILYIAEG